MDPITSAIVAALSAGAVSSVGDVAKKAINDAYKGLKALIKRKFGDQSQVVKAVDNIEEKPDSKSRAGQLQEEIAAAKADQDPELQQAAKALLEQIRQAPGGEQHIQQVIGSNFVAQADRGGVATVSGNAPDRPQNTSDKSPT